MNLFDYPQRSDNPADYVQSKNMLDLTIRKPKQPGTRYRARRDPDHDGLWVIVDRVLLKELFDNVKIYFDWWIGVVDYRSNPFRFPSIQSAISFIELLELSDEMNKGIV